MKRGLWFALCVFIPHVVSADCLDETPLRALDNRFDLSLANGDLSYFENSVHPDFVWVHDHASMIQGSKEELLAFLRPIFARIHTRTDDSGQRDVQTRRFGSTAVVFGFKDVHRNGQQITFHFMRTYSLVDGECLILSNHTMEIPPGSG